MKLKIDNIKKEIEQVKDTSERDKKRVDEVVRPSTIAANEFRSYVKNELENNWKKKKEKIKERVSHLRKKFTKRTKKKRMTRVPETYKGVKISDKLIGEVEMPRKTKVHEDVELNDDEIDAVEVLPKDTFYSNISKKDGELQTEICFAKMRWGEIRDDKAEENNVIYDDLKKTIDLSKKRATEMRSNQRVKLVDPDCDDEKESKRDNLKIEIQKVYKNYIDKNCNKDGEIKHTSSNGKMNPIKALNSITEKSHR